MLSIFIRYKAFNLLNHSRPSFGRTFPPPAAIHVASTVPSKSTELSAKNRLLIVVSLNIKNCQNLSNIKLISFTSNLLFWMASHNKARRNIFLSSPLLYPSASWKTVEMRLKIWFKIIPNYIWLLSTLKMSWNMEKTCKFNQLKNQTKSSNHFRLLLPVYPDMEKLTFVDHNGFRRNL